MGLFIIVARINTVEGSKNVKPGILTNNFTIEDGVVRENIGLSLKSTVEVCKECDIPKETIIIKIAEKYSLSEEDAAAKVEQYL